jgi:prophage maintenance system killer protein
MVTFLELNGCRFQATDADVIAEFLALAGGSVSEEALAAWIDQHSAKRR